MSPNEQELYLKDFFLIAAAAVGLIIILVVHLKNFKFRMRPIGRRKSDLENFIKNDGEHSISAQQDWARAELSVPFISKSPGVFLIWYISPFSIKLVGKFEKQIVKENKLLFKLASSPHSASKIINPIFLKAQSKFKNTFLAPSPIQLITHANQTADLPLYTWLKSKSQIRTAVFAFLEESAYIANELSLTPQILLSLGDDITCEVHLPFDESLQFLQQRMHNIHGVECIQEKDVIKLILWIAFAQHRIPPSCVASPLFAPQSQTATPWAS